MTKKTKLPKWADYDEDSGIYYIDPLKAYPFYINKLGLSVDKYGVELARRCCIKDLSTITEGGIFKIVNNADDRNHEYALRNLKGNDSDIARASADFTEIYNKLTIERAKERLESGVF